MKKIFVILLACCTILLLGLTVFAETFKEGESKEEDSAVTAEITNEEQKSGQSTVVLSVSTDESEGFLAAADFPEGSVGPDDFIVLSENDILIMDTLAKRVQRFRDGELSDTYQLAGFDSLPRLMEINDGFVYVLGHEQLTEINLETKDFTVYVLPDPEGAYGDLGVFIYDLISRDGQLLLMSSTFGNYRLDREKGEVVPTDQGYTSVGTDHWVNIQEGALFWSIIEYDTSIDVLCIEKDNSLLVQAVDFCHQIKDRDYLTVRQYSSAGELLTKTSVDVSERTHVPRRQVKKYGGQVYQMLPAQDVVLIKRIELSNDLKEAEGLFNTVNHETQKEQGYNTRDAYSPQHVLITRNTALSRALSMKNQQWQLRQGHKDWSSYGAIGPTYLSGHAFGTYETGIPYCYGGFNGYETVTNEVGATYLSYSSIVYQTISNTTTMKNAAGNIKTTYFLLNTIGVDCSGYACSAYGFTNKLSANTFRYDITYFKDLLFNVYGLLSMDLVVKGTHVMLCWSTSGNGNAVTVLECRTSEGHVDSETYTKDSLNSEGYEFRRPMNWCYGAWNEIGDNYGPD